MNNERKTGMPPESGVRAAIEHAIDYLWDDERSDFEGRPEAARDGHVFESLREIQSWLNATESRPAFAMRPLSVRAEGWSL